MKIKHLITPRKILYQYDIDIDYIYHNDIYTVFFNDKNETYKYLDDNFLLLFSLSANALTLTEAINASLANNLSIKIENINVNLA